jgi:phosphatidylglycerol:prolipoprotein diacylglycerol transferase
MLPNIHAFGLVISMYWLSCFAALLVGGAVVFVMRRGFGIKAWDLTQVLAVVVIGAFGGAKLFHILGGILQHGGEPGFWTRENWAELIAPMGVFYGGLLCALGLVLLFAKWQAIPLGRLTDLMAYFAPAFGAVARFGCLFAGCCYGIRVSHMFTVPGTVYEVPRLPSPLLETGLNLLILLAFLLWRPERKHPGAVFPLYLLFYSAGRFVLRVFRGDAGRGVFLLSTSQWIAIAVIVAAGLVLYRNMRRQTLPQPPAEN